MKTALLLKLEDAHVTDILGRMKGLLTRRSKKFSETLDRFMSLLYASSPAETYTVTAGAHRW